MSGRESRLRIGLVDLGLDPDHAVLNGVALVHRRFGGRGDPHHHGTRSAALLAGTAGRMDEGPTVSLVVASIGLRAPDRRFAAALHWVRGERVPVVCLPLGQSTLGPLSRRAIHAMQHDGIVVVASAGNAGPDLMLEPAALPGVRSVTGIEPDGRTVPFCCSRADLRFPGRDVPTGVGLPDTASGSSPACALAARWVALERA